MAVSRIKENYSKNENICNILYHLATIWNNDQYVVRSWGKNRGYALKQTEFSNFKEKEDKKICNPTNERKFREYKEELLHRKLIHELFTKSNESGRPYYQITPLGVAYLIQNIEPTNSEVKDFISVIEYYLKGKHSFEYNKIKPLLKPVFSDSCKLISFEDNQTIIQTKLVHNIRLDLFYVGTEKTDYSKISHYIIGNMCWFVLASLSFGISQTKDKTERKQLKELRTKVLPKEIAKYGKAFAKEISELLEMQNNVVKEVLTH